MQFTLFTKLAVSHLGISDIDMLVVFHDDAKCHIDVENLLGLILICLPIASMVVRNLIERTSRLYFFSQLQNFTVKDFLNYPEFA